jgi:hypothetical protein
MKIYLNNICEFFCFMAALYYYPYLRRSFMKWFLYFLALIFFGELIAQYKGFALGYTNYDIYYFLYALQSVFYGFIFHQLSQGGSLKKLIYFLTLISLVNYCIGFGFYLEVYRYFFLSGFISGLFLVVIGLGYLYQKSMLDNYTSLTAEPGFWITVGVTVFYSIASITFALSHLVFEYDIRIFGVRLYNAVDQALCVILYGSIVVSFRKLKMALINNPM